MNELTQIANKCGIDKGSAMHDAHAFTEFYYDYFEKIKNDAIANNKKVYILEIGILYGGSLKMYNEFFGKDNCEIYGLDLNLSNNRYHEENVHTYYTNQDSIDELLETKNKYFSDIKFDIILDDGGHAFNQQFNTLIAYHNILTDNGIYIIEDLHSNVINQFSRLDNTKFGEYVDSPLYFLTTKNKSKLITNEQYYMLLNVIKDVIIYKRENPKSSWGNTSITSVIKMN